MLVNIICLIIGIAIGVLVKGKGSEKHEDNGDKNPPPIVDNTRGEV